MRAPSAASRGDRGVASRVFIGGHSAKPRAVKYRAARCGPSNAPEWTTQSAVALMQHLQRVVNKSKTKTNVNELVTNAFATKKARDAAFKQFVWPPC